MHLSTVGVGVYLFVFVFVFVFAFVFAFVFVFVFVSKKDHLGTGLLSLLPLSALLLLPRLFIRPDILLIALIA